MKARRVKGLDPKRPLAENAGRIVRVRLDELRSFAPGALEPEAVQAQHDMRIAAKRLRYILEVTGFCFGEPADGARRGARDLQDLLGEMHDCDVLLPRIRAQLDQLRLEDVRSVLAQADEHMDLDPSLVARAPHRTAYRGLQVLSVHVEARRRLLFERFGRLWREQERLRTWERLETATRRAGREARERRASAKGERVVPDA